MASSRLWSNGPDWKDVVTFMLELEEISKGQVTVTLRPAGTPSQPSILMLASLWSTAGAPLAPSLLASASVSFPGNAFGGIEMALYSLMLELDKDYYRRIEGLTPKTA